MDIKATIEALRKRFTNRDPKEGAEEISKALPEAVMPRPAILKKRQQLKDLDAQTKED